MGNATQRQTARAQPPPMLISKSLSKAGVLRSSTLPGTITMTSSISVDEAKEQICENGFYAVDDPEIGSSIEEMDEKELSYNFSDETGYDFCLKNVLLNSPVQDIIDSLKPNSSSRYLLMHRGYLAQDPGHIYTLRNGGEDRGVLVVQLWTKGSRVTYHRRSHLVPLTRIRAANKLWEVASKQLQDRGCEAKPMCFEQGGLVISDARISFERDQKRCYYYTYVESFLLEKWEREAKAKGEYTEEDMTLQPPASRRPSDVAKLGVQVRRTHQE
ncbi:hypothetical protein FOTG_17445 [Fusarium oxysporum f. sp. vasinfectum 25433]|uniref:Uncharacterized protein n=1 Tax=Fusarium oxysporum f. sp. vasinfectum 25433 TaxID=1089449 RepID=X0M0B2_FUSOX|nr:hypothetical protein FOTG_17445 [Fusarium oxysporum f. sp. vasinfectum 25433]